MSVPIYITGVRPGEFILGTGKQNKGSLIQVHDVYPSSRSAVLEQSNEFFRDYLTHSRFKNMTPAQRRQDLLDHSVDNDDLYLSDLDIQITPYRLIGEKFENIDFKSEPQSIQVIYKAIPGKVGSRARRHTLVFRPHIWTLYEPKTSINQIDELPTYQIDTDITYKLRNWTPGMLKSLLQKIIRSGMGSEYIADVFFTLARHPGSFVPDLQKFVSGYQSAYKRLCISLLEDSYVDEQLAIYLMNTAMIEDPLQQQQLTKGITEQLRTAFDYCKSARRMIWSIDAYYPSDHQLLRDLETIRSFKLDIWMTSSIIKNKFAYRETQFIPQPLVLAHALDQHCCPFIWYLDEEADTMSREDFNKMMWDNHSDYNVREGFREIIPRDSQLILEQFYDDQTIELPISNLFITMTFEPYNLAGEVGDKVYGNDIYFMNPRDPDHIMHIPRLTRDNKEVQIKNDECPAVIRNYFQQFKSRSMIEKIYPMINYDEDMWKNAALIRTQGVCIGADDILIELSKTVNIQRLLFHCHEWCDVIDFDTDIDHPSDPSVFQFLLKVISLYPSALYYHGASKFKVKDAYLFHHIIKLLRKQLKNNYTTWKTSIPIDNRTLWPHQEQALSTLMAKKKNIVWIPVGLGKTLIVIRYMVALQQAGLLPEYVVYSMPKSAFDSVIREFKTHQLRTSTDLKSEHICVVEHDSLRKLNFEKPEYSQCLFIMDELHKALNKTIRTSQALRLSKLCRYFVGMTGTIVNTSSDLDDILQWLRPFSDFPVSVDNTYTSIASLIAYRMDLDIDVKRMEVITDESPVPMKFDLHQEIEKAYRSIYSAMNSYIENCPEPVFVVVRKKDDLKYFNTTNCFIIGDQSITWTPKDSYKYRAVFTTVQHSTGYTLTALNTMLTSVYFSNNMTREQLEGRLIRLGQTKPVSIITFHCGILSHILRRYDRIRNFSKAVKQIAANIES